MIQVITDLDEWRKHRKGPAFHGHTVGFVPTMGALHEGHMSLVRRCLDENDITVVSIFVNPTQFNDPSDLNNYPQTFEQDCQVLDEAGVHYVLAPNYDSLYPDDFRYRVVENDFSRKLCGAHRPGHFVGVLTIVLKLLNLVKADRAYFGEKDHQQLLLIDGMVKAFFLDTEIVPCPIIREPDGLACSSRNLRLTVDERARAALFPKLLQSDLPPDKVRTELEKAGFKVDYVEEIGNRRYGAVHLGKVRLIDNVKI